MKSKLLVTLVVLAVCLSLVGLVACDGGLSELVSNTMSGNENNTVNGSTTDESTSVAEAVTDTTVTAEETTEVFEIATEDGEYVQEGAVYTITKAGTYSLSGALEGQILVEASEDDEVVLELNGVTITYGEDSPIKVIEADKVEISAKKGTENVIKDTRSVKTVDTDAQGEGAIYAKCDLKLKGNGVLVVTAGYNNGIHTTKDLSIKNLSLKVTAVNNAIKGNDSVTVESGTVVAISTKGDGIKTENTDANKNGEVRGDVTITGGSVAVYAAGDGIQAAHNFEISAAGEEAPSLTIYTGSYSGYTASNASTTSYKGVKVQNELNILAGEVTIHSYDDGLHADYGTTFEAGGKGQGTINISGGTVTLAVYSPTTMTMGGMAGPGFGGRGGGWSNQQSVKGADGIHADYQLNISGGVVNVDSAYEGLEGNLINISGGTTTVAANDDGINACSGVSTPLITVSGGYLDVTVSPSGDMDGIDSNGSYVQTGGVVITRGPNNQNMAALDVDERGSATISGGTLVVLGYANVKTSGSVRTYSLSLHAAGSHSITVDGVTYTFKNASAYGKTTVYSSVGVTA